MASSEIVVTVGADTTQLEKGLNDVTKEAAKSSKDNPAKGGGIAAMLGKAYGTFSMIFSVIKEIFDFVMKYATIARELRNLSVATSIPIDQLRKMEIQAKQAGISLQTMAHSMAEFNKNMGRAKIAGSEVNALLAKLGVGMADLSNGTFKYNDALVALAASYEAGTDEATLMYYGVQLFGSSFEQLLPLIKQGTADLKKGSGVLVEVNADAARGAARFADIWDSTWQTIENTFINVFGSIVNFMTDALDGLNNGVLKFYHKVFSSTPEAAGKDYANDVFKQMNKGLSKEQQKEYFRKAAIGLNPEEKLFFDKQIKQLMESDGKKLTPLGLSEAQGASTIQQMGGGDFISAIAFTPLERIATATEQTAKNTEPEKNKGVPTGAGMGSSAFGGILGF